MVTESENQISNASKVSTRQSVRLGLWFGEDDFHPSLSQSIDIVVCLFLIEDKNGDITVFGQHLNKLIRTDGAACACEFGRIRNQHQEFWFQCTVGVSRQKDVRFNMKRQIALC